MNRLEWPEIETRPRRARHSWTEKFGEAFRGMKRGMRGHSSFSIHFFFAALAIAFAISLDCSLTEWCLIVLCIGGVMTTELLNSSIETLFHGLDEATRSRWNGCLEIAAGAVLMASMTAVVVGGIIFVHRLMVIFG